MHSCDNCERGPIFPIFDPKLYLAHEVDWIVGDLKQALDLSHRRLDFETPIAAVVTINVKAKPSPLGLVETTT